MDNLIEPEKGASVYIVCDIDDSRPGNGDALSGPRRRISGAIFDLMQIMSGSHFIYFPKILRGAEHAPERQLSGMCSDFKSYRKCA